MESAITLQTIGELLILSALATNVVAGVAFGLVATGRKSWDSLAVSAYRLFGFLAVMAGLLLFYLFFSHNYAFKYVFEYSQRSQPFFYILSAFWGGQEGTYLLWLILNALFGFILLRGSGRYREVAMAAYAGVNLFLLLILTRLSPFALLPMVQADGLGLNPLLRDPWMVVHPPIMFIGYAATAPTFAIAMAALIKNDYAGWPRRAFPWVALTATMLAAGNILGGFWAYKTLGWGGYWGWDPVENSSLVPWAISLALIHGMILERRAGTLRKSNLLLAGLVFLLVVYGTFLTRSGVLADFSVHSFTDLGINIYLIGFMVVFAVSIAVVFLWRRPSVPVEPMDYNFYSRSFSLFAGMIVLLLFGLIVLFWTSLPVLTSALTSDPRAADIATYNKFAMPLAIMMAFFLTVSPYTTFQAFVPPDWKRKVLMISIAAAVLSFGMFVALLGASIEFGVLLCLVLIGLAVYLQRPGLAGGLIPAGAVLIVSLVLAIVAGVNNHLHILFISTAAMAVTSNVIAVVRKGRGNWASAGGVLTHFGYGLMLIGIMASSAHDSQERLILGQGQDEAAFNRLITYDGMNGDFTSSDNKLLLSIESNGSTTQARPGLYYSQRMDGLMRQPFISRSFLSDLYLAPVQINTAEPDQLTLQKSQRKKVGDYAFTFLGYDVGSHGDTAESFRVAARLAVVYDGDSTVVTPAMVQPQGQAGRGSLIDRPAVLPGGDSNRTVSIAQVLADEGAVVLSLSGVGTGGPATELVLEVSRKPLMNLVWGGAVIIILGTALSLWRRSNESVVEPSAQKRI